MRKRSETQNAIYLHACTVFCCKSIEIRSRQISDRMQWQAVDVKRAVHVSRCSSLCQAQLHSCSVSACGRRHHLFYTASSQIICQADSVDCDISGIADIAGDWMVDSQSLLCSRRHCDASWRWVLCAMIVCDVKPTQHSVVTVCLLSPNCNRLGIEVISRRVTLPFGRRLITCVTWTMRSLRAGPAHPPLLLMPRQPLNLMHNGWTCELPRRDDVQKSSSIVVSPQTKKFCKACRKRNVTVDTSWCRLGVLWKV